MAGDRGGGTGRPVGGGLPDTARGAIGAGRDLYRRGAIAVVRTAGDQGALMVLAAGAAIAGVSWLLLRRRGKPGA